MKVNFLIRCAAVLMLAPVVLCSVIALGAGGSPVNPASCTITNLRGEATAFGPAEYYTRGNSILFTNCLTLIGSTATTQTLTNVTVLIALGTVDSHTHYTGTVQSAANGTWWLSATVPTSGNVYVETKLIDENTNSYTYSGWKILNVQQGIN